MVTSGLQDSMGTTFVIFPTQNVSYRVPPKGTQWVLFEFVCKISLNAMHLTISRRRIRIIPTEFLSGEHGRISRFVWFSEIFG
jgi:hypothetical protein